MIVTHDGSWYVARTEYADRERVKAAGFLWVPALRIWRTKFPARAAMLRPWCDERALLQLESHFSKLEASRATDSAIEVPAPDGLSYLPYQKAGIAYAYGRPACLIADEPGLGKTIQALGVINLTPTIRTVLLVCPTSLRLNWKRETTKWLVRPAFINVLSDNAWTSKSCPVCQAGPDQCENLEACLASGSLDTARLRVVITNYERMVKLTAELKKITWDLVILDEAHYIKNPKARRAQVAYSLGMTAKQRILLTGTPILNRPVELQPLAGMCDPDRFGDPRERRTKQCWSFLQRYCNPPEAPIWMGDYTFKPIGDVRVGDTVIGWTKSKDLTKKYRRLCLTRARVSAVHRRVAPIIKVTLASGRIIRCTADHRWLNTSHNMKAPWICAKVGRNLSRIVDVPEPLPTEKIREAAWLGGIFDGEGTGDRISQSQSHNPQIFNEIGRVLTSLGLPHTAVKDGYYLTGGRQAAVKFVNYCKPVKSSRWTDKRILGARLRQKDRIVSIEEDGIGEVVGLTTETGNYVVWGYASKNCGAHQEIRGRKTVWVFNGATHLDELQERLRASIMVRRLKAEVLTDLPPKRRQVVPVEIEDAQMRKLNTPAGRIWWEALQAAEAEAALAVIEKDKKAYAEAAAKLRYLNQVAFTEMSEYRHTIGMAKVARGVEYVMELLEGGVDKVVVFAHHRDVLEAARAKFSEAGLGPVLLYGGMKDADKDAAVIRFQGRNEVAADPTCRVFLGQIQAAGTGLTLTASSHVVFIELDWVPANTTQAEDRCHRLTQRGVVFVHHLVVDGSLDAHMVQKMVAKQEIAENALDTIPDYEQAGIADGALMAEPKLDRRGMPKVATSIRKIPPVRRTALLEALRFLSDRCDGAKEKDGNGFNGMDSNFGKNLAGQPDLSDAQYYAGWKLVRKYRKSQLPKPLVEALGLDAQEAA